jgi:Cof subfamily protein (haloacid dehalogenase superfamily)
MPTDDQPSAPTLQDVRLVVADMDGTLLDERGAIPDAFWPVLDRLSEHGIVFAVASGRQYAALAELFGRAGDDLALIAENGAYVVRAGQEVSSSTVEAAFVDHMVAVSRELAGRFDLGLVWSGPGSAYVERSDPAFLAEAGRFYTSLRVVDDLGQVTDRALKFAVYDVAGGSAGSRDALVAALRPFRVVMSSEHWMDIMDPAVNKGVAVQALQRSLGIGPDQTMAFGDYLNDLEMLAEATHSFAMANAHPRVARATRHRAPSNAEHGVVKVLDTLLG